MADILDPIKLFDLALGELENAVIAKVDSNIQPPNAPSTIKKKKSSHTLIDTGAGRNHITHKMERKGNFVEGFVGIFVPEIAEYMWRNEMGVGPPERSFLRSAWDEKIDTVIDDLHTVLGDSIESFWKA